MNCREDLVEVGGVVYFVGCLTVARIGDSQGVLAEDFEWFVEQEYTTSHEEAISTTLDGGVDVLRRPEHAAHLRNDEPLIWRESTVSLVWAQVKVLVDGRLQ